MLAKHDSVATVMLTGGCGFIGSNLVRYLLALESPPRVVNFDGLTYAGNQENLRGLTDDARYVFVPGRVEDRGTVERAMREHQAEVVIHLAAETHVDRSIAIPAPFVTTNVVGTQVVLDACAAVGISRLVYVSTDEVYGPSPSSAVALGASQPTLFDEHAPLRPSNPYAASKAAADLLVQAYRKTYCSPTVIARPCNTYGPQQFPEKLMPLTIVRGLAGDRIPIYGDGQQQRDWLHVDDLCRALWLITTRGTLGQAYNVSTGARARNIDVVRRILHQLGRSEALIEHVSDRPGHDRCYAIDSERIRRELGWAPRIAFDEGVAATVTWYEQNLNGWRRECAESRDDLYLDLEKKSPPSGQPE
jgi:dTDP-glucose 4,6-dehydratase